MSVRIGLVGAGPWASRFTAPMLARAAQDGLAEFAGIWARRPAAAAALAAQHGTVAVAKLDLLLAASDALVFSVPPHVQPELAARAAPRARPCCWTSPSARR